MLKLLSYNPPLAKKFTSKQGIQNLKSMKISLIATDFDSKKFDKELNQLSLKIIGILSRSNLSIDLSAVLFT